MQGTFGDLPSQSQESVIGKSIVVKGEIAASGPLYVYGQVEGLISATAQRVTVCQRGKVDADVSAREVIILGALHGNLDGGHRVEIRSNGSFIGNLTADRLSVDEGAVLSGSIEVRGARETNGVQEQDGISSAHDLSEGEPVPDRRAWEARVAL